MGTSNGVYLGVYIEIPFQTKVESVKNTFYIDGQTGKRTSYKFSPENGNPNEEKQEVVNKVSDVVPVPYISRDEAEKYNIVDDTFFMPAYHSDNDEISLFILNSSDSKYGININIDILERKEFGGWDIEGLVMAFNDEYKNYIEFFEEKYDCEIMVKYGVVTYAH